MELKFTGKVKSIEPLSSFVQKNNGKTNLRQSFVLEDDKPNYPNSIVFELFGDKTKLIYDTGLKVGDYVEVCYSAKAREFNGKWYNSFNVWKISKVAMQQTTLNPEPYSPNLPL